MRSIDGHALMESLQKATFNAIKPDFAKGLLEAQRLTINAPTIDVVEVVRCKDCKYKRLYDEGETKYYYCALEDRPNRNWTVDDTDYCSWGRGKQGRGMTIVL